MPKLNVRFVHKEHCIVWENNIFGIQLKSVKSQFLDDIGESTRLDLQLDFSEIHLLKEVEDSMVDIQKLLVISSIYIPSQHTSPIRSEFDVKLEGTQCNLYMEKLKPLMKLMSSNKKNMVLRDENMNPVMVQSSGSKAILWTCSVSAPNMKIVLFNFNGFPIYHGCLQSSHVFAYNISSEGPAVHLELEELNLHMENEYQDSLRETFLCVETSTGSLLHITNISLNWGKKENESLQDDSSKFILVLSVDITSMGVNLTFTHIQSLLSTAFFFSTLLNTSSPSIKSETCVGRSTKPSGRGIRLIKFNLERCSVNLVSEVGLENEVIEDPALVNFGSQGGRVLFNVIADGTSRTAKIQSRISNEHKTVKYFVTLHIYHVSLCLNKERQFTKVEFGSARSVYQEYLEDNISGTKVTLFDMQKATFVSRADGLKDIAVSSLFSTTDITVRWEPDVHLALLDLWLRMKQLYDNQSDICGSSLDKDNELKEESMEPLQSENRRKLESLFAIDIGMLTLTAEAGDGVEALIQIQSIFSENARIGVLLEGITLKYNGSRVLKSGRMQLSCIPNAKSEPNRMLDWVFQALDIHICIPYRLQLVAFHESIQEMLQALKLVSAAKTKLIFPFKESGTKPEISSSLKIGCVKVCIRKLTADIEEEPMQGWLDEHYRLMKNEACEVAVRLAFLDSVIAKGSQSPAVADEEIDLQDTSSFENHKEEIYKQSFRSYYRACQNLVTAEISGPFQDIFQSGFKLSKSRKSLFSITATELDLSLSAVEGGEAGMIHFVQSLDPVARENKVPFSCLYGCNIHLKTGSLVVQLRNYTYPLLSGISGCCEGRVVLAQQATPFQPQVLHDVYIGRWRKVQMYRSVGGTTPPMKTYWDLPLLFEKGNISYGVGFEPAFADLSYAFTVALRRANLSVRNPNASNIDIEPLQKEESLPWWDEMRSSIHGKTSLSFSESTFNILATTDPYEKSDKLQITSRNMELQHSDGRINVSAKDFKMFTSGLENLLRNSTIKLQDGMCGAFLLAPIITLEVTMDWECESGNPLNHFLFALPSEGMPHERIYDPFRSTSLSLRWNLSLRSITSLSQSSSNGYVAFDTALHDPCKLENNSVSSPTLNVAPHDFAWLIKFCNLNSIPPHKLRYFSQWPRFRVPRVRPSCNLPLGEVITEFMFRIDSTPTILRHMSLHYSDPAKGLTFETTKLKFEMCYSRGKKKYSFESKRDILDLVYQGLDLHMPKVFLNKDDCTSVIKVQMIGKNSKSATTDRVVNGSGGNARRATERHRDDGFLLSSDYFTIRRQSPNADPARLLAWQKAGRRNPEMTYVRSEFEDGSESDEQARFDPSKDDGYNVVIADNCSRIFVYGLKLLWTIENRNAVWSWVGEFSKAYTPSKPSPSRQYAQRKLLEGARVQNKTDSLQEDVSKNPSKAQGASSSKQKEASGSNSPEAESLSFGAIDKHGVHQSDEEGTRRFMVNVIEPQFNLHSEDANGRFLLAAVSGQVLARSFHEVLNVGIEMIKQALGSRDMKISEISWNRMELSVMLENVQAHVAPTDTDQGAGLQWLPKISRSSPRVRRTGALLERVFMPSDMYFRYTLYKGGKTDLKVIPLKEMAFNSHNITATMTSHQFHVMLDVLTNLLFATSPTVRRSSLPKSDEDDEDIEEVEDELVLDGVEEIELERVNLEQKERAQNLLFNDIRKLSVLRDAHTPGDANSEKKGYLWMISGERSTLVHRLRKELISAQKSRKMAAVSLRIAMLKAAQLRLLEKEKNKSPSYAIRVSLQINKVVWGMLVDGKSFAEAEINDMIFDFERDFKDVGLVRFTTKYFVVRNCLPIAKSDMLISAWNPPHEWGKMVMLRVDAKQGAPKDGKSPIESFQVDIYPLKIHLTETMYRMMWEYFFLEEEQNNQRPEEICRVSSTAGLKRAKQDSTVSGASTSSSHSRKKLKGSSRSNPSALPSTSGTNHSSIHAYSVQGSKGKNGKTPARELSRPSSFDIAESVTNELMLQLQSSSFASVEEQNKSTKTKSKTAKTGSSSQEEKKIGKPNDEKRSRPRVTQEFYNIKISQVELLVTYEGSRLVVSELRLLMDTYRRVKFTGTWQGLFSRVKKHITWGVFKSVIGMQGKKFKDRLLTLPGTSDLYLSDSDEGPTGNKTDQVPVTWPKEHREGAGDGFVYSIRGLFNSQRRKPFVLRTMRGERENDLMDGGDWSESDTEHSPFARQLTIAKARKLIRRHTKKFRAKKGIPLQQRELSPIEETIPFESSSSSGTDSYEDFL